jgi:Primase C terminal 1 (PriCT-1)
MAAGKETYWLLEGERNDAIFRLCCSLRRYYRDDPEFVLANAAMANIRCVPPMSDQELHQCVESAFKQDHDTLSREASVWVEMLNASEGWEHPIPLHSATNLPPFPMHALPPVIKNWCEAVSHELQMPIELAAGLVFAVIANGVRWSSQDQRQARVGRTGHAICDRTQPTRDDEISSGETSVRANCDGSKAHGDDSGRGDPPRES